MIRFQMVNFTFNLDLLFLIIQNLKFLILDSHYWLLRYFMALNPDELYHNYVNNIMQLLVSVYTMPLITLLV